jgi:hypothetical protein
MIPTIKVREAQELLGMDDSTFWHLIVVQKRIRRKMKISTGDKKHYYWELYRSDVERLAKRKAA